jgi:hypothetical protein
LARTGKRRVSARVSISTFQSEQMSARPPDPIWAGQDHHNRFSTLTSMPAGRRISLTPKPSARSGEPVTPAPSRAARAVTPSLRSAVLHVRRQTPIWLLRRRSPNTLQRRKCPTPLSPTAGFGATFPHEPETPDLHRADRDPTTTTAAMICRVWMQAVVPRCGPIRPVTGADSGQTGSDRGG